jgi:hypothetical protein
MFSSVIPVGILPSCLLTYLLYIAIIAIPVNNKKHKKIKKVSFGTKPQPTGTAKTIRTIVLVTGGSPGGEQHGMLLHQVCN